MLKLKPVLYELPEFVKLRTLLNSGRSVTARGIFGSFLSVVINYVKESTARPQLVLLPDQESAEKISDDLRSFMPAAHVAYFPSDEVIPFDRGLFTPALYSTRMSALAAISEQPAAVLITTPAALMRKVPPPETFRRNIVRLAVGENFDRDLLIDWLAESGYQRVPILEEIGQFSVRGGILDVFSFESELPCRIEFFGDTIESLREFDVLSQLSVGKVERVRLLARMQEKDEAASVFDYFDAPPVLFWEDPQRCLQQMKDWLQEAAVRREEPSNRTEGQLEDRYLSLSDFQRFSDSVQQIRHLHVSDSQPIDIHFHSSAPATFQGNIQLFTEYLGRCFQNGKPDRRIYVLHDGKSSRERLQEILEEKMQEVPPIFYLDGELHHGFSLPAHQIEVLTDHEIFNRLRMRRKKRSMRVSGSLIRNLQSLEPGDYVVHVDYGVGKYLGTERIQVAGLEKECIKLIYENDDILYVTLDKLNRIQRYVSEEGHQPRLTRLGGSDWERLKGRTRKAVENIARDLVELYANRISRNGYSFSPDGLWQRELEATFPFEDTPDQARATDEVKQDMESSRPMDRLVCGDVGYGKTEVGLRAAFKAVVDGKQVAVLVPTTVLAQQHFNTFRERLANFPVKVEVLSRFRNRAEQNAILERLANGEVDIIIGTHRLLSKDVVFKDLGLLIIDEEQRFGVSHKERLRQLKVTVDTLTLTATPIPRTLHMSLMGARDLSIVDTPPGNRLPIITEITTWDNQIIYRAITYEMSRGGQVFFVHNRIQTIEALAEMIKSIVPRARLAIAHGQMQERQLEKIMYEFYHKQYDVLISTMIIENGLDIPNCNTIIVNRADRFGLAQLYQLRGRVGRSDRQAYAYLIIPPQDRLNDLAIKRLYAIEEFADLGSGMKIAMRDLEIRGAGNLLGHRQSGFINAVGYDLYQKILQETVESLQEETLPETYLQDRMPVVDAAVEIDTEMYFPEDYIPSPNEKVMIYHRLLNLGNLELIDNLVRELEDRFGQLPEAAESLIEMVRLKKLASQLYVRQLKLRGRQLTLVFDERATTRNQFVEKELPRYIDQKIAPLKFVTTGVSNLRAVVTIQGTQAIERLRFAKNFLRSL